MNEGICLLGNNITALRHKRNWEIISIFTECVCVRHRIMLTCWLCVYTIHLCDDMSTIMQIAEQARPHQSFIPNQCCLQLHSMLSVLDSTQVSSCLSAVHWCHGANGAACVWDDSIWAGLMGLICSNWKRCWSWSSGWGPPGAYCCHTSACLLVCMCVFQLQGSIGFVWMWEGYLHTSGHNLVFPVEIDDWEAPGSIIGV